MTNIGALLADQVGPPDLIAAWDWYERAADTGDTGELNNLGNLLARPAGAAGCGRGPRLAVTPCIGDRNWGVDS
jgi:TPR repeat protein